MEVKFPDVTVPMVGEDGNVFAILGRVKKAMEKAGYREEAQAFIREATACHSYDEVLATVMEWVDVS